MGLKKEVEAVLNKQVEQEFDAAVVPARMTRPDPPRT